MSAILNRSAFAISIAKIKLFYDEEDTKIIMCFIVKKFELNMANNKKLVSFDLRGDFAFFKKPDYNDGVLFSYNMLHKPALLGILGAIIGLKGYERNGELPEYYLRLKDLPIGVEPLKKSHDRGSFQKTTVEYINTIGYANTDGNLLLGECMLIKPAYRCYLLLDMSCEDHERLFENLRDGKAEYIPYLGKNEFQAWWLDDYGESTFQEYVFEVAQANFGKYQVVTLINKPKVCIPDGAEEQNLGNNFNLFEIVFTFESYTYFETLPVGFNLVLFQYELRDFVLSNFILKSGNGLDGLYFLPDKKCYVQLH
ncbi:CRISPR-associated protein Cas5 [Dyadobacter diqingensis]|uniref:CRISPR-associated protein Cas5 n=1 Tax=Dyadobacter diqingensis TaxID=2938121 RepID=UPI0020C1A885|nr:CRISPR-associated protein Cas5 [Dyadobacter diqingensis]